MNKIKLSILLLKHRRENKLTQVAFSKLSGFSVDVISRIECCKSISDTNKRCVYRFFNLNIYYATTARKLWQARFLLGLTRKQLEQKTGINHKTIFSYEHGNHELSQSNIIKLEKFFNIPIWEKQQRPVHNWGDRLYNIRAEKRLSIADISRQTKLSRSAIRNLEKSGDVCHRSITTILKFYNVSANYIVYGNDNANTKRKQNKTG